MRTLALISLLSSLLLLGHPIRSQAGCGCDKPPPVPAAVIPNFASGGTQVTFFYDGLQPGQQWTVTFQRGSITTSARGFVVLQRALTDPTGQTSQFQLVVTVPAKAALGPTQITASTSTASFVVPHESFTVVGKPLAVSELEIDYDVNNYQTAVGSDGTLYIGVGGLADVCKAMAFSATIMNMTPGGRCRLTILLSLTPRDTSLMTLSMGLAIFLSSQTNWPIGAILSTPTVRTTSSGGHRRLILATLTGTLTAPPTWITPPSSLPSLATVRMGPRCRLAK